MILRPFRLACFTATLSCLGFWGAPTTNVEGGDWARFRGPNGSGVSTDTQKVPTQWSNSLNLRWKTPLLGPGLSSPIVVDDRVFVTCWSGYGTDRRDPGDPKDLKRHLMCLGRAKGDVLWSRAIDAVLPEDPYRGMFTQHGYASHTPASDGKAVYAFFGKTGVVAFDLEGERLWQTSVGTGSGIRNWGTASSPVLYKDTVIVTASAESDSLVGLDKKTGKELWRQETEALAGTWGTPILVDVGSGRTDLVIAVPYEIWGLNPANGKLRWYCEALESDSVCSSVVARDGVVYAVGGRGGGTIAVRAGGKGDVTKTHVLWTGTDQARIGTPVLAASQLCWVNGGILNCVDVKTGKSQSKVRLKDVAQPETKSKSTEGDETKSDETKSDEAKSDEAKSDEAESNEEPRRNRTRRGGRGGRGGQDYSSPVVVGNKLYYFKRSGTGYVVEIGSKAKQLSSNRFGDEGDFSASPAVSDGALFVRSTQALYCVAAPTP